MPSASTFHLHKILLLSTFTVRPDLDRDQSLSYFLPPVFPSGNQVTRLVNRMEVLSEELHPPWQCERTEQRQAGIFVISSKLCRFIHVIYASVGNTPTNRQILLLFFSLRIKVTAAISADFVCLPSGLPLCLCSWIHTRVCTRLEDRHWRNCWQDVPLTVSDTISCLLHVPQRDDCVPHSLGSVTTNSFPPLARY